MANSNLTREDNKYIYEGKIGSGRYGNVFRYISKRDNKNVAIKILKGPITSKEEREVDHLMFCFLEDCTNIVKFVEHFMDQTMGYCIVMEYCRNGNLSTQVTLFFKKKE